MNQFKLHLSKIPIESLAFRLHASPRALEERVRKRSNSNVEEKVARSIELGKILENAPGDLGLKLDTTDFNPREVVSLLLTKLKNLR